jgi:hypothetical protein
LTTVDDLHSFSVDLPAHHGMSLLVEAPLEAHDDSGDEI